MTEYRNDKPKNNQVRVLKLMIGYCIIVKKMFLQDIMLSL